MCRYADTCVNVCLYVRAFVYMHFAHVCMCLCVCMSVYVSACMYVTARIACACTYVCIRVCRARIGAGVPLFLGLDVLLCPPPQPHHSKGNRFRAQKNITKAPEHTIRKVARGCTLKWRGRVVPDYRPRRGQASPPKMPRGGDATNSNLCLRTPGGFIGQGMYCRARWRRPRSQGANSSSLLRQASGSMRGETSLR